MLRLFKNKLLSSDVICKDEKTVQQKIDAISNTLTSQFKTVEASLGSFTISAGNSNGYQETDITSYVPSGYKALGSVGHITGSNECYFYYLWVAYKEGKPYVYNQIKNRSGNSVTVAPRVIVLCVKEA